MKSIMTIKERIIANFNKGAATYDKAAILQAQVAHDLSKMLTKKSPIKILEIGCGTGTFSQYLISLFPQVTLLLTDIAAAMVEASKKRFQSHTQVSFQCIDGELIQSFADYDLIVSSMTFQWFQSLEESLLKMLQQIPVGGRILFSLLGDQSLREWRSMCNQVNVQAPIIPLPSVVQLQHNFPEINFSVQTIKQSYPNLQTFLFGLKKIGATATAKNSNYLSPTILLPLLRKFNHLIEITYEVIYGEYIKC